VSYYEKSRTNNLLNNVVVQFLIRQYVHSCLMDARMLFYGENMVSFFITVYSKPNFGLGESGEHIPLFAFMIELSWFTKLYAIATAFSTFPPLWSLRLFEISELSLTKRNPECSTDNWSIRSQEKSFGSDGKRVLENLIDPLGC
jgi:hypothetical protein